MTHTPLTKAEREELPARIEAAITTVCSGMAAMSVPANPRDVDLVLADCAKALADLDAAEALHNSVMVDLAACVCRAEEADARVRDVIAHRDRAESERDSERKMRIEAEAAATRAEAESATFSRRLAEALVRNDEDDLGCDRARMEEMRDERDALKAQEGEWADQIAAALNSTADKLGRTPSMIAGYVRREHEAHTACFDRLRKAVDERDALKAKLADPRRVLIHETEVVATKEEIATLKARLADLSEADEELHTCRALVNATSENLSVDLERMVDDLAEANEKAARSEKDSHSWHELYKDTKAKLAALVKAADPFACDQGCDAVHHPVRDRHDQRDNCPVVARLRAAIAAARGADVLQPHEIVEGNGAHRTGWYRAAWFPLATATVLRHEPGNERALSIWRQQVADGGGGGAWFPPEVAR